METKKNNMELCHHGVKGMKWGVVHEKEQLGRQNQKSNDIGRYTRSELKDRQKSLTMKSYKRGDSANLRYRMNDVERKKYANNRVKLYGKRSRAITSETVKLGEECVKSLISNVASGVAVAGVGTALGGPAGALIGIPAGVAVAKLGFGIDTIRTGSRFVKNVAAISRV